MKKWDSLVLNLSGDEMQEGTLIRGYSIIGWELVSVVPLKMCRRAYFKREIPEPPTEPHQATIEEILKYIHTPKPPQNPINEISEHGG
jgi:hypothetical protein